MSATIGHNSKAPTRIQEIQNRIKARLTAYREERKEWMAYGKAMLAEFREGDKKDKEELALARDERKVTIKVNKLKKMEASKAWAAKREISEEVRAQKAAEFLDRYSKKKAEKIAKLVA